jgi:type IV pilus assembly protein PilB
MPADDFVLQLAREKGLLRDDQLAVARNAIERHALSGAASPQLRDVLVATGAVTEDALIRLLAQEFGMAVASVANLDVPKELQELVPANIATRYCLIPLRRTELVLHVAISDPLDSDGVDYLARLVNLTVETSLASAVEIHAAIDRNYNDATARGSAAKTAAAASAFSAPVGATEESDAPVVRYVTTLIADAIQRRASDIHLEPLEKRFRVRYRIDGVLLEVENPPKHLQLSIVSRLKIMADISIAEKRIPQDGRIQTTVGNRTLDLRVSTLPSAHGESVVMRILDKESLTLGLPQLGFLSDDQSRFERVLTQPDGIVLVTGPTGSGKTTTLYSCLHHLNKPDRKIITVEDPVEYQLTGVNQVAVREDVGMTFASALRAMLRQAPNIIMIGEIRDLETAEIAINASLTGHMVFSTLHTNDAPGAVTRLIDLGAKPYMVATALRAVLAQRLVRKVCQNCSRPYQPSPAELAALNLDLTKTPVANFQRGSGCAVCNGTGFHGRIGLFEMLSVDEEMQRMIYENAGSARIREAARAKGMLTMREDGARKVIAGLTTVEEVVSITVGDAN